MKSIIILLTTFLIAFHKRAQQNITGTIRDQESNEPIAGVTISIKNKPNSQQSNSLGEYTITASAGDILLFTYIGYQSQEIVVGNQTTIDVFLLREDSTLEEVVVIGYGTARKRDLTGSITQIKGSDIVDKPGTNPIANLQGKVPGLQVTNSGRPGQEPDIRIRGTNSINGAKPLYVVDGMLNDNINFLNPNDIESIEVLRDPSSLAIFGNRGTNGVIAITTKRGKVGQLNFELSSRLGFKNVTKRMDMADAAQFRELYDEQRFNQGDYPYDYTNWTGDTDWQEEIFSHAAPTE